MAEITYTGCHKCVPSHSAYEPAAYYFRDDFFLQQMTAAIIRTGELVKRGFHWTPAGLGAGLEN